MGTCNHLQRRIVVDRDYDNYAYVDCTRLGKSNQGSEKEPCHHLFHIQNFMKK